MVEGGGKTGFWGRMFWMKPGVGPGSDGRLPQSRAKGFTRFMYNYRDVLAG